MTSSLLIALFRPVHASAQLLPQRFLSVSSGFNHITFMSLSITLTNFMLYVLAVLCGILFLVGAYYVVASGGNETTVGKGKDLMIGSLIGLAVALSAYAIIRTVFYVIFFM